MRLIRTHPLWVAAILALVLRTAWVIIARPDPMDAIDSPEYDALARALLAGRGIIYYQDYARPPLYPLFVALCYATGGIPTLIAAQLLLSAATAPLVGALSRALSRASAAAPTAAFATAIYPWFFQWVGGLASETLFTFLLVVALTLIVRASVRPRRRDIVLAGIVFGFASLARANALVLAPPIALWWWWRSRALWPSVLLAAGVLLALAPYTAYNLSLGRGIVLGSNGGGISFYAGNSPDASRWYSGDLDDEEWRDLTRRSLLGAGAAAWIGCPATRTGINCVDQTYPPNRREAVWYSAGMRYITSRPGEWALLEVRKLLHFWRPWVEPRAYGPGVVALSGVSFGTLLFVAIAGLLRMRREAALFVVAVAIGATASAVIWNVQLRYRFAMLDPVLIAAAGPALAALIGRLFGRTLRPARIAVP